MAAITRLPTVATTALLAATVTNSARAEDWNQFYVGGGIGVDAIEQRTDIRSGVDLATIDSFIGGDLGFNVTAGYDHVIAPNLLIGAFADYSGSTIETTLSADGGKISLLSVDSTFTLGGRAGVLLGDDILFYGLAGWTRMALADIKVAAGPFSGSFGLPTFDGITLGVGVEHRLSNNLSLRGEYRLSLFGEEVYFADDSLPLSITGEPTLHQARVVAAYRFGGADDMLDASYEPSAIDWTAIRFTASADLSAVTRDFTVIDETSGNTVGALSGLGGGQYGGGLTIGYDRQLDDQFVIGLFGSFDTGISDPDFTVEADGNQLSFSLLSVDHMWTIGARAGLLADRDVYVYGLAGYSRVDFNDLRVAVNAPSVPFATSGRFDFPTFSGVTLGLGFEKMLHDGWSLSGEYRYTALGKETLFEIPDVVSVELEPQMHAVRIGLSYRFDTP